MALLLLILAIQLMRVKSIVSPHPSVTRLDLPLAPYNVKIYCQSGLADSQNSTMMPILCPSASTTCGYFGIPFSANASDNKTVIYECIDSSVFMREKDESDRDVYFTYLCSHQSRCHKLSSARLNRQFLNYLEQTHNIDLEPYIRSSAPIKFCCSVNHNTLNNLVSSGNSLLVTNSTQIQCGGHQCLVGAVGCMSHKKEKFEDIIPTISTHDYLDVRPVEIVWEYDESLIDEYATAPTSIQQENEQDHLHCVFPHFNDEVYRYCLMIEAQTLGNQCWKTRGMQICCCFVEPGEETCTPSVGVIPIQSTSTTPKPRIIAPKNKTSPRRKIITGPPIRKKKCQHSSTDDQSNFNGSCEQTSIIKSALNSNTIKSTGNYLLLISVLFILTVQ